MYFAGIDCKFAHTVGYCVGVLDGLSRSNSVNMMNHLWS